jgi:hypothetical protein
LPHGAAAEKSCHEQPVRWTVSSFLTRASRNRGDEPACRLRVDPRCDTNNAQMRRSR